MSGLKGSKLTELYWNVFEVIWFTKLAGTDWWKLLLSISK